MLALAAIVPAHAYAWRSPAFFAVSYDYRGEDGRRFGGMRDVGLYAAESHLGFMMYTHTYGYLEPGDGPPKPIEPTQLIGGHSDVGIMLRNDLAYHLKSSHLGVSIYDGAEAGMGHEYLYQGLVVNAWLVEAVFAGLLGLVASRAVVRRQVPVAGRCWGCGYDIRTQLRGQAGDRCPECGTAIDSPPILQVRLTPRVAARYELLTCVLRLSLLTTVSPWMC